MTLTPSGPTRDEITVCKRCRAEIMFLRTRLGRQMPVNVTVVGNGESFRAPNHGEIHYCPGEHQSHFATCVAAAEFRRPR